MRWGIPVSVLTPTEALLLWSAARTRSRASEPRSYAAVTVRRRAATERSLGSVSDTRGGAMSEPMLMPPAAVAHPPRGRRRPRPPAPRADSCAVARRFAHPRGARARRADLDPRRGSLLVRRGKG